MKPMRLDREGLKLRFCGREKMPTNFVSVEGKGVLTESDLEELEQKIKEQISTELSGLRADMDARFDKVEERLDRLEGKIDPSKPS